jgi:uncharacterized protein (UPF0548 family)
MFFLSKPAKAEIDEFLRQRENDTFSYSDVGASRDSSPSGYDIDHNCQFLGTGSTVFEKAKNAVRQWKMFDVAGLELFYPDTPIEPGQNVALLADHLGFHSLNSCRIVYVIDELDRFGFAYGTLSQHAESGEERFTVEYQRETEKVWYDIYAFSRPANFLVRLGYLYARRRQKQFSTASKAAMLRAVSGS